ncbi:HDHD3 protein, partial [Atractosteus spatula]|nr:HDHD3 protein [Atractosteus spatula]
MRVRWVTWDVKDTLLRVRCSVGEQYCSAARRHGLTLDPAAVESAFRQAYRQQESRYPNYGHGQGLSSRAWWGAVVQETFSRCGVAEGQTLARLAEQLYAGFSGAANWEVFADSESALRRCQALGLRLAVVSNFDGRLEAVLRSCGLRGHFQFVVTSESAGAAKPDPRIFLRALELSGEREPAALAHVGDHHLNDYLAAQAVGMRSFLLERGGGAAEGGLPVPPQHRLRSLDELPALLQQDQD